jgi:3-oxoadipate CoA-transferase alpha subunit
MGAAVPIVQTKRLVAAGDIDPEHVITPGIFVNRVVEVSQPVHEDTLIVEGSRYP